MNQREIELQNERIALWVEEFGNDRSALLPILQEVQAHYDYVSPHAMQVVAGLMNIHPVEVYGVVTFYSFLTEKPGGKCRIRLCKTISCDLQGKEWVAQKLKETLGIDFGETTSDGLFTLEWAACIGMCDQGPALLANGRVYPSVTPEKVPAIIEECRAEIVQLAAKEASK